jgi:hypothetical protein
VTSFTRLRALRLVDDEADGQVLEDDGERVVDLGVESGAIFGLHGPRGAVWARAEERGYDGDPPERPSAA